MLVNLKLGVNVCLKAGITAFQQDEASSGMFGKNVQWYIGKESNILRLVLACQFFNFDGKVSLNNFISAGCFGKFSCQPYPLSNFWRAEGGGNGQQRPHHFHMFNLREESFALLHKGLPPVTIPGGGGRGREEGGSLCRASN